MPGINVLQSSTSKEVFSDISNDSLDENYREARARKEHNRRSNQSTFVPVITNSLPSKTVDVRQLQSSHNNVKTNIADVNRMNGVSVFHQDGNFNRSSRVSDANISMVSELSSKSSHQMQTVNNVQSDRPENSSFSRSFSQNSNTIESYKESFVANSKQNISQNSRNSEIPNSFRSEANYVFQQNEIVPRNQMSDSMPRRTYNHSLQMQQSDPFVSGTAVQPNLQSRVQQDSTFNRTLQQPSNMANMLQQQSFKIQNQDSVSMSNRTLQQPKLVQSRRQTDPLLSMNDSQFSNIQPRGMPTMIHSDLVLNRQQQETRPSRRQADSLNSMTGSPFSPVQIQTESNKVQSEVMLNRQLQETLMNRRQHEHVQNIISPTISSVQTVANTMQQDPLLHSPSSAFSPKLNETVLRRTQQELFQHQNVASSSFLTPQPQNMLNSKQQDMMMTRDISLLSPRQENVMNRMQPDAYLGRNSSSFSSSTETYSDRINASNVLTRDRPEHFLNRKQSESLVANLLTRDQPEHLLNRKQSESLAANLLTRDQPEHLLNRKQSESLVANHHLASTAIGKQTERQLGSPDSAALLNRHQPKTVLRQYSENKGIGQQPHAVFSRQQSETLFNRYPESIVNRQPQMMPNRQVENVIIERQTETVSNIKQTGNLQNRRQIEANFNQLTQQPQNVLIKQQQESVLAQQPKSMLERQQVGHTMSRQPGNLPKRPEGSVLTIQPENMLKRQQVEHMFNKETENVYNRQAENVLNKQMEHVSSIPQAETVLIRRTEESENVVNRHQADGVLNKQIERVSYKPEAVLSEQPMETIQSQQQPQCVLNKQNPVNPVIFSDDSRSPLLSNKPEPVLSRTSSPFTENISQNSNDMKFAESLFDLVMKKESRKDFGNIFQKKDSKINAANDGKQNIKWNANKTQKTSIQEGIASPCDAMHSNSCDSSDVSYIVIDKGVEICRTAAGFGSDGSDDEYGDTGMSHMSDDD